jgi:hypothetical protein
LTSDIWEVVQDLSPANFFDGISETFGMSFINVLRLLVKRTFLISNDKFLALS